MNNNDFNENENNEALEQAILKLQDALKGFNKFPNSRDLMWDIIFKNEINFNKGDITVIKSDYIYYHPLVYLYSRMASFSNNSLSITYGSGKNNKQMSLLAQNNAKNIILLNELNYFHRCLLMSTHMHGTDFVAIEIHQNKDLVVLDRSNPLRYRYVSYDDINEINYILTEMEDKKHCQEIFKLQYHNIEAKSSILNLTQFTFFDMITSGCFFKDTPTVYKPAWHESLYIEDKPLAYDGFIKTWFLKNSNRNVTLMFLDTKSGQKLTSIVDHLRTIFSNLKILLKNAKMGDLSEYYMKIEPWMLYKNINWNLKLFDKWVVDEQDDGKLYPSASLERWSELYSNIDKDEFYTFIKKRLIYIFHIYARYRYEAKLQLLNYLEKIRAGQNIKDETQIFIEGVLNQSNILYRFQNAQSIRLTGGVSTQKIMTNNEVDEYLNLFIGKDDEFINLLKKLGTSITENDPNILISDEEYKDILDNNSELNDDFSKFRKPWRVR